MAANRNGNGNGHTVAFRNLEQQRRSVDFLNKRKDQECALLVALGYSNRLVFQKTGYSNGQIHYRARKAGISRMDFRNGEGVFAKIALAQVREIARPKLISHLQRTGVLYAHAA